MWRKGTRQVGQGQPIAFLCGSLQLISMLKVTKGQIVQPPPDKLSPFSIAVLRGDHLWEVYDRRPVLVVQKDVELVEVTVNQAVPAQLDNQVHQLAIQG